MSMDGAAIEIGSLGRAHKVSNPETIGALISLWSSFCFRNLKLPLHKRLKGRNVIGANMRKIRYAQKPVVTLDDLMARMEVKGLYLSKSTLSKIETGQRIALDFEALEIARALRTTIGELYGEK